MNKKQSRSSALALVKRIAVTIGCCLPFILLLGLWLEKKLSNGWIIFIFVVIMLLAVIIEELIHTIKKDKNDKNTKRDVFK